MDEYIPAVQSEHLDEPDADEIVLGEQLAQLDDELMLEAVPAAQLVQAVSPELE